jgi:hypothetical protein
MEVMLAEVMALKAYSERRVFGQRAMMTAHRLRLLDMAGPNH